MLVGVRDQQTARCGGRGGRALLPRARGVRAVWSLVRRGLRFPEGRAGQRVPGMWEQRLVLPPRRAGAGPDRCYKKAARSQAHQPRGVSRRCPSRERRIGARRRSTAISRHSEVRASRQGAVVPRGQLCAEPHRSLEVFVCGCMRRWVCHWSVCLCVPARFTGVFAAGG